MSTAYVFMFGQSMLLALGIPINPTRDLHARYSDFVMLKGNVFTFQVCVRLIMVR